MKSIIAMTDFSLRSINAVNYAADLAQAAQVPLTLFHAYIVPIAAGAIPYPSYASEAIGEDITGKMEDIRQQVKERTLGKVDPQLSVMRGDLITSLTQLCDDRQDPVVVTGPESVRGLEWLLFDPVTLQVSRQMHVPVIIVPPKVRYHAIRRAGLACDLQKVIQSVHVRKIKDFVTAVGARLHVIHVNPAARYALDENTIEQSGMLQELLASVHPTYHFIKESLVEDAIQDLALKLELDVLIVVPKSHSIVNKIFGHSHSKEIILHSEIPVMTVHE